MMRLPAALFLLIVCCAVQGKNLFPEDTGFETGVQNFRYYRSEAPVITVSGDAAEGNSSLEIDSANSWVHGRWGYAIRKGTDYTVSFHARRISGGDRLDFAFIGVLDWKQIGRASFRISDEWKRYSCHIRTDREGTVLYPAFLPQGDAVFRIDAIQLQEGKTATEYRPAEPFSIYPSTGASGEVVHTPEIPELTVRMFNAELPEGQFTLRITLSEREYEHVFSAAEGERKEFTLRLPEAAVPGYYVARVAVLDGGGTIVKQSAAPFVVTPPFPEPSRTGFFGMQASSLPDSVLPRIGASYLRTNLNPWKEMEVSEGVFREYSLRKPASLFWHPTLHSEFTPGKIPPWGFREGSRKADLNKAALFLEHFFRQFQGQAEFIDFINEPDLEFRNMPDGAEYYCELLKNAAPIARKYGVKLMVDSSGNRSPFFDKVFKEAHDSFDISGPHPYCSPRIIAADGRYAAPPEKGEFASSLRYQSELARRYGKELVIGELGYSLEETVSFDAPQAQLHAAFLARMFLIAKSYPECRHLIWFTGLDRWESGPFLYGIWRTENGIRPLPAVAAYAQAAHEIDHAEEVKWILDDDIKVLSFRKAGRVSYAVWNAGDDAELPALNSLPEDAAIRSIYGSPLKNAVIGESPVYLSENEKGTVLPALLAAVDSRPALAVRGYLRDRDTLKLILRNRSFSDWKGELEIAPNYRSGTVTVPRQSAETLTVKLSAASGPLRLAVRGADGKSFDRKIDLPPMFPFRRLEVKELENFDFRSQPGVIVQSERSDVYPSDPSIPWSGPADLSHRTLLGWDEENLYIFSEVRDDVHMNPWPDHASWRGDSLQVGIDSFNDADGKLSYDADDHEFTFALGKKPWSHQGPPTRVTPGEAAGVRRIITRNEAEQLTVYRIAIPRKLLAPLKLREGTVFGIALCFNDEDPGERRYCMTFGTGIADLKCPANFSKAVLVR